MALFRTLSAVVYVDHGKVVSVNADRVIELTNAQAEPLLAALAPVVDERDTSMFPEGAPVISPTIVRDVPVVTFAPEPAASPAPEPAPEPAKAAVKAPAKADAKASE